MWLSFVQEVCVYVMQDAACVHFPGKVTISSSHSFHLGLCALLVI